ncbi:MAG TPA: trehalose-6-phosphate synthase [Acidimicrobiia bacterium]|nr:trehalose-6-phosphate synthase [Acidimicrobiia bacterium]
MIVASHRGPQSFVRTDDGFEGRRGAGGVVSALRPLLGGTSVKWVAAPVDDDDRAAVAAGAATSDEFDLHLLPLDPVAHRLAYHVVSNSILWFLHHGLFDLARRPVVDARFREAWNAYEEVNQAFADEIAGFADHGEIVLVQDYHLALVPGVLCDQRPDLKVVFFQHTPFCGPTSVRILPDEAANHLLGSLAAAPAGFHVPRWARAYRASAAEVLGAAVPAPAFAASLGPDPDALHESASSAETEAERRALDDTIGDRRLILRVDRIEPSKNILRGFQAFDLLLEQRPDLRGRVVFGALVYPSREGLPEYLAYRQEVEQAAVRVNDRWATGGWQPVLFDAEDTYARSLAGLMRYDVLLVNPIRDGLNLVAKEGPVLNQRDGQVVLSREAGAYDDMGDAVFPVNPFDLVQTAEAMGAALDLEPGERAAQAKAARELAEARTPRHWLDDLLAQAGE